MNGLLATAASALVIVPILLWLLLRSKPRVERPRYQRQSAVFAPEQRALYRALREALGARYDIVPRVAVGELIAPVDDTLDRAARAIFDELAAQCFAFVLCRPADLSAVAAIDLVSRGRSAARGSAGGMSLRTVCEAAGLPLVTVEAAPLYDAAVLQDAILAALKSGVSTDASSNGRKEPHISSLDDLDLV